MSTENKTKPDHETFDIDWVFHGLPENTPEERKNDFIVYFTVNGESGPLGAMGLIMDQLRGIGGKYFVKKDIWKPSNEFQAKDGKLPS